jgi:imidazolonepropionase-like amidohydrolase
MKTILSHANLIDCVELKVRPDTAVLIEDGRIRAILPNSEAGGVGDAQVIDLKGGYLIPVSGTCISIPITCRSMTCHSPIR